jgi:two-component system, NtrC family, sensor histidine kinase HydH
MHFINSKRLYLPAFTIIAVVLLLIFLIAVSTYRNLNHQRETALAFLHSQGLTLFHALEAATLTGMRTPTWGEDSVGTLIHEIGKDKNVAYIYIFGKDGIISHDSDTSEAGTAAVWRPHLKNSDQVAARLQKLRGGAQVYEMAKLFSPFVHLSPDQILPRPPGGPDESLLNHHAHDTVVIGLSMAQFRAAHRADLHHALIMGSILFVLGTGAFFFAFVIQNYYLVDKALNKSRDYLRLVMASVSNGMLSIDANGRIITFNEPARSLLGIEDKDIRQIDLRSIIDFRWSGIDQTLADGAPVADKEITFNRSSGRVVLSVSASPIIDENKQPPHTGAVIILRDLTEIKRLQEKVRRSEKLAAIGELAAGIAHEVRNPLSSIRGFAQFLKHVLQDRPKECEYAELMVKEVDRINNVVTNLLSFARPVHPEPAPTNIAELIRHTVRLVQEDATIHNVTIAVDVAHDLGKVNLDGNQITQVMLNLILNALQAVDQGGHIQIAAGRANSGGLELVVEDDGPGIPPDRIKRIFDPFFTTKERGTGLGLSIVQMIVENHGGEISIASSVRGRGCRIAIALPMTPDANSEPMEHENSR